MSITTGIIVSAGLLLLLGVFGPQIRQAYLSARGKMRAATEKRRARKKKTP